jgi:hypothetical protein
MVPFVFVPVGVLGSARSGGGPGALPIVEEYPCCGEYCVDAFANDSGTPEDDCEIDGL